MKIAVTGALGHIGSFLIRDMARIFPNIEILLIDNLMTQRFSSLFNLPANAKYSFIDADVIKVDLEKILDNCDILIHLAAMTDAAGSFDKAELVEANNFNSTVKVAEACLNKKIKLILVSSTSVYGTQFIEVNEDCQIQDLNPQSPYAETKLREERYIFDMKNKGLEAVVCRFGTIYGISPGMRFHTAVNKFCWQAVMGTPLTIWKTAFDQKRPYLSLYDASSAICHIINKNLFNGEIYNILTNNHTVREVVDSIRKNIESLNVEFVDNKIMNQLSYEVNATKFMRTGYIYKGDLESAIEETIHLLKHANT
jgi:UDP-glucose 4-epimerase